MLHFVNKITPNVVRGVCDFKFFLTCVRSDVALEEPGSGEALAAEGTLAALVVRAHVHRVGGHGDVHLVAVRTPARLFVLQRPVRLAVSRQVAGRAVPA
jgi:hypothetical protein